jgi:hypothetical protein
VSLTFPSENREMRESLRNTAVWGYFTGVKRYGEGTKKANSGWFEALTGRDALELFCLVFRSTWDR